MDHKEVVVPVEDFWEAENANLIFGTFHFFLIAHWVVAVDEFPPVALMSQEVELNVWLNEIHFGCG